ncbi:hypothetical protein N0V88_002877 [Collariella sp. IMI 366227]|nr:hypothetical protein N0V88_002877 [Collariella sp. IMI 366227]
MGGNGDYGLETLAFVNTLTRHTTSVDGALVAALNDTNYYQGYIGVGVTQGKFGSNLTNPFISQLAQTYGTIPSHGYGYTAGAYYRASKLTAEPNVYAVQVLIPDADAKNSGTVASLTLGGYDSLRYEPHEITFSLDTIARLPTVRLRGITAQVPSMEQTPTKNWTSTSERLVEMDDSIVAVIDSSTPYLWLPTEVCNRFAAALNLTWREDLGVYVFADGAQYTHYRSDTSLSFTFTLSSYQDADNFGEPYNTPGVVNITLPSAAFAQLLRYPFKNMIQWGDSSVPYFPLKRSTKEVNNNQYIIGRVFMQEAYIITSYDRGRYSLHQALFPDNAISNYSLEAITRPEDSPYPRFEGEPPPSHRLKTAHIAGIVISTFITGSILALVLWFCLIRKPKTTEQESAGQEEEIKDDSLFVQEEEPESPVKRMFSKIIGRRRLRRPILSGADRSSKQPAEVGADAQHQVFEMPVPPEPVELDSHDVGGYDTELGVDTAQGASQYEVARRKLDRQLQGPVPTYTASLVPPRTGSEKSMQDMSLISHYRPADDPSPASSPTYANSNSLPASLPSPMTPHGDWASRAFDPPSPGSSDTLGSNFTMEEENRLRTGDLTNYEATDHQQQPQGQDHDTIPRDPRSMGRIEAGSELIHVPQVAEKRYSWEDQAGSIG